MVLRYENCSSPCLVPREMNSRSLILFCCLVWFCSPTLMGQENDEVAPGSETGGNFLENGGFENSSGWIGKDFALDQDEPFEGENSGRVDSRNSDLTQAPFTVLRQSVDPTPLLGKRIRFTARVRTSDRGNNSAIMLWLRVDRPSGKRGAFDNMQDRPITCDEWEEFEIVVDVADDAKDIFLGMIVGGSAQAWIDDASLEVIDNDVPTTGMSTRTIESPFYTSWLWLVLFTLVLFTLSQMENNFAQRYALRFTICYWILYSLVQVSSELTMNSIGALGSLGLDTQFAVAQMTTFLAKWGDVQAEIVGWVARVVFRIKDSLPPPGGSGDTTHSFILLFIYFSVASGIATIWTLVDPRKSDQVWLRDVTRTFLRYALATSLFGYGIIKLGFIQTQFASGGVPSEMQLVRTYGESSPMGLLWTFMAASSMYTFLGGLLEMIPAFLLMFRRTSTIGAAAGAAVMSNVFLLNMCYDVPVKQFSFHLLVMGVILILPELPRIASAFFWNRTTEPSELIDPPYASMKKTVWAVRINKTLLVLFAFVIPLGFHGYRELTYERPEKEESEHLLINQEFRWINEYPSNR